MYIRHIDAVFNCCLDSIHLDYVFNDLKDDINILDIYEIEYTDNPCKCNCAIDLEMQYFYSEAKTTIINFFVKYYSSEDSVLIHSDTLTF